MRVAAALFVLLASCGGVSEILEEGEAAEARGDGDAAGRAYWRAVVEFPERAEGWAAYGEHLRFRRDDAAGARRAFERAIAAPRGGEDSRAFAWRGMGELARDEGRVDDAIRCFEKSLSLRPLADTHRSLSALYATERRDFERAARHARAAVDAAPGDPIALLQLAVQLRRQGAAGEARAAFERALRLAGCDDRGAAAGPIHC